MVEIASAVFGFFAPFATELVKFFNKKQDNKQELALMQLQMTAAGQQHLYKMAEINAIADIEETKALQTPTHSYGIQMLDAARDSKMSEWALTPSFLLFVFLDFFTSLVRPMVTYAAFLFYAAVKWSQLELYSQVATSQADAILSVWSETDMSVVILVLSYWFGQRAVKAAFGNSNAR